MKQTSLKNKFKNIHLTSTFSMSLVLFLVGLVSTMLFVAHDLGIQVKENINLSVILEDNISDTYRARVQKYIENAPFSKSVMYVSKEAALNEHIAAMGEDPQEFLGYNPLRASLEVKLKAVYANTDSVDVIESKLKAFDDINRVTYQRDMVNMVNENINKLSFLLLGLAIVLLIVSTALINNTVRLSIYANRFLINTMKLVGATSWFVRKPYIIKGVVNGIAASFVALIMLSIMLFYILRSFGMTLYVINPLTAFAVSTIVVVLGIVLTALSSYAAVGRYLKMNRNDMYFV